MPENEPSLLIRTFLGLMNTERDAKLPPGALSRAINVDIDNAGAIERRAGYTEITGLAGISALYATRDESRCYAVADGVMYRIHQASPLSVEAIASGIAPGAIYWDEIGDKVFFSGAASGEIEYSQVRPLRVQMAPAPLLEESAGGTLARGIYRVACVFRDAWGREGGCLSASIEAQGTIRITAPMASDYTTVLYASAVDGDVLFRVADLSGPVFLLEAPHYGATPLSAEQLAGYHLPAGTEQICVYQGRLYAAIPGDTQTPIYFSHPFWFHLFDALSDVLIVPGTVRMMAATSAGMVIGTDRAIWGYVDGIMARLADYGVPEGSSRGYDDETLYFWTQRGFATAFPFANLTYDNFINQPAQRVAVGVSKHGTADRLIASLSGVGNG